MSYTHDGRRKITLHCDPLDPDSTDTFFFSYGGYHAAGETVFVDNWLRAGETITTASALITGGTVVSGPDYSATRTDEDGTVYADVYAIEITPSVGATRIELTCRVSTDGGRANIDRTIVIPVKHL